MLGTSWREMFKVFNCGHRMELYVRPEHAAAVIAAASEFNIDAQAIGYVEAVPGEPTSVLIDGPNGAYDYTHANV